MTESVVISNFSEVQRVVKCASMLPDDVGVHDVNGSIADAKSILGMMSLTYNHPVKIVSENPKAISKIKAAIAAN